MTPRAAARFEIAKARIESSSEACYGRMSDSLPIAARQPMMGRDMRFARRLLIGAAAAASVAACASRPINQPISHVNTESGYRASVGRPVLHALHFGLQRRHIGHPPGGAPPYCPARRCCTSRASAAPGSRAPCSCRRDRSIVCSTSCSDTPCATTRGRSLLFRT